MERVEREKERGEREQRERREREEKLREQKEREQRREVFQPLQLSGQCAAYFTDQNSCGVFGWLCQR